ncbi:MAG: SelB C-terminal domain-containing protein [Bacteroidetes bacterium]|nr:SelB C-terminal domain-containing protein [Bacteroidota bacterium]
MDHLHVTYRLEAAPDAAEALAEALLLEQTVETPRRVAERDAFVRENLLGYIHEIRPDDKEGAQVVLALPLRTASADPSQFLNVLFGNTSLHADVTLEDFDVPPALHTLFRGPRFGLAGLRARTGVPTRPLTATALKPVGLSVESLAALCRTFAEGGIDLIKDDHYLGDHAFCPFEERVRACQAAVDEVAARTGHRTLYLPNLSGTPDQVHWQADLAQQIGVSVEALRSAVERGKARLLADRERRPRPGRDEKVLTAWNALMLRSFAEAASILGRPDYRQAAVANASFLLEAVVDDGGRLLRAYKDGQAKLKGYLEDYAFLIDGLLALHGAFEQGSFSRKERELLLLAVSTVNGCTYCVPAHSAAAKAAGQSDDVIEAFREAGLRPPQATDLSRELGVGEEEVRPIIALCAGQGQLVHIGSAMYLHREWEAKLRASMAEQLRKGPGMTVSEIKDLLGTTRKFAVPMCEYLDRIGLTRRVNDVRVLANPLDPGQR